MRGLLKRLVYGAMGRIKYYGSWIYFPRGSSAFRMVCREGVYEPDIVRCIQAFVRPGAHFFDVGANIGLMSAVAAHAQPTATVISFEPSPSSAPYLRQTAGNNAKWRVVEKALADKPGKLDFTVGTESLFEGFKPTANRPGQRSIVVPVSTLDAEWAALGRPDVSVVKIDVEGAEALVLGGGGEMLRAARPVVIMEWFRDYLSRYGNDAMWLLSFAESLGYLIYSIPHYVPIRGREDFQAQMISTTNFLLLPKARG